MVDGGGGYVIGYDAPDARGHSFALPRIDLADPVLRRSFIRRGRVAGYGECTPETERRWMAAATDMIERGNQLGEGVRYFWERLLGRAAPEDDVATFGPYAGLVGCHDSLTRE